MKLAMGVALALLVAGAAQAETTHTKGYVKKDGTYVAPHYKTAPNSTKTDNYSSKPNVNPYTGKKGTVDPYAAPKPKSPYTYGD